MSADQRDEADVRRSRDEATEDAEHAVFLGLMMSAVRCLITYVAIPAAGATLGLSGVLGPLAATLQVLAAAVAISGTRRLWRLGHPLRWAYIVLSGILVAMAIHAVVQLR